MVYVQEGDTGYAYLLKGYKQDFFRFNTVSGVWDTSLPMAPAGMKPKWDKGSWVVYDGTQYIYAHKAKYHELWQFDVATHTWGTAALPGMPLAGMMGKSKKSKDGGSAAYYARAIYALKGGNTQEFWKLTLPGTWTEKETLPAFGSTGKKKRVKAGADIVPWGGATFYAMKGNKTLECWRYVESGLGEAAAVSAVVRAASRPGPGGGTTCSQSSITPGGSLGLPGGGVAPAVVRVYDVLGREVFASRASRMGLAAGVYLIAGTGRTGTVVRRLVVR
jgi:hypothetical protein